MAHDDEIKDLCRKLKPFIGVRADRHWSYYITSESPLAKSQIAADIQALALKFLGKEVDDRGIYLPPPPLAELRGDFPLGDVYYGTRKLGRAALKEENFVKHIAILATTGAGKTVVAQNMILGLLRRQVPLMVVDWKRSYRDLLSHPSAEAQAIKVFTVGRKTASSFVWNPLRGPPGVHPQTWIAILAETLERSHISGQGSADVLIDILDKKFHQFGVYGGIPQDTTVYPANEFKWPNFFDALEEVDRLQVKARRMLWKDTTMRILRTFTFGPAAGAFNARHPMKLEDLLYAPVILELDQELPKPLRIFMSEILLRWIHLYRLSHGESEELRHVLFLEEAHNLFTRANSDMQPNNSIEYLVREIRSFGQGLVFITQHPSMLPIYVLGNTNTQIYLALQHEADLIAAKRALFLNYGEEVILDRLPVGEGIVKIKSLPPFHVKFPNVQLEKGSIRDEMLVGSHDENRLHSTFDPSLTGATLPDDVESSLGTSPDSQLD